MQIIIFILAIVLFIGLVVVHEFGHFIVARRNGVKSEEFGIGFPPRAWKKKLKSGLVFSLNWLPLGGFVKMKGESDSDTSDGSFGAASTWSKSKILLAGVGMNLIGGLVLLTILAWVGMPVLINKSYNGVDQFTVTSDTKIIKQEVQTGSILADSPAHKAGLKSTDILVSISNQNQTWRLETADDLHSATNHFAGQKVTISYMRHTDLATSDVQLLGTEEVTASRKTDNPKGYLGVVPNDLTVRRSTWSAPIVAVGFSAQLGQLTLKALGHSLAGLGSTIAGGLTGNHTARENGQTQASAQVGGPVAIMSSLWNSGELGINFMLAFVAVISLTLVLINILPIPALDGGRLAMILFARLILRRPLSKAMEEKLVGSGIIMILVLVVLITIVDVKRFF